jgi:hypothetical protein
MVIQGGKIVVANGPTTPGPWSNAEWSDLISFDKTIADQLYASKTQPLADYANNALYNMGDVVLHNGHMWAAKAMVDGTTTPVPWDPASWTQITVDVADVTAQVVSAERFQGIAVGAPTGGEVSWAAIPAAATGNKGHYYMSGEATTLATGLAASDLDGVTVQAGDMIYSDGAAWHVIPTGASGASGLTKAAADAAYANIKQPIQSHDGRKSYAVGDLVIHSGQIYVCKIAGTGAWDSANWTSLTPTPAAPQVTTQTVNKPATGAGQMGDLRWNDTHLFLKTNTGWKSIKLDSAFA